VLPVQQGRSDAYWTGYMPFDAMPSDYNPETGYVINSNNRVASSNGTYFLSHEWAESARHDRIKMLLDGLRADHRGAIDVKSMMAIQLDTVDLVARRLLPLVSSITPTDEQSARALVYIKAWDGDMSKSSVAASIFHTWMRELRAALFEDDLEQAAGSEQLPALLQQLLDDFELSALADVLEQHETPWCDDVRTTSAESCADTFSASLKTAVEDLSKLAGPDMRKWQWGEIHLAHYGHVSFANRGVLGTMFDRRLSSGGSVNTVNVADAVLLKDEVGAGREIYSQNLGANFRQIVKLDGETRDHVYMNMSGQSESLISSHYDDMTYELNEGVYNSLPESASEAAHAHTTLVPTP
jgi:penicillin amidase